MEAKHFHGQSVDEKSVIVREFFSCFCYFRTAYFAFYSIAVAQLADIATSFI